MQWQLKNNCPKIPSPTDLKRSNEPAFEDLFIFLNFIQTRPLHLPCKSRVYYVPTLSIYTKFV